MLRNTILLALAFPLLPVACDPDPAPRSVNLVDLRRPLALASDRHHGDTRPTGPQEVHAGLNPQQSGECDMFAQDCQGGEKCAPSADNQWYEGWASQCFTVTGNKTEGDPCTVEGSPFSGEDDCAAGFLCWNVDGNNQGTCVKQCSGTEEAGTCEEDYMACVTTLQGAINICIPTCDPLVSDCNPGTVCLPSWGATNADFLCSPDVSGEMGQTFDPCEFANACDPGLLCVNVESVGPECAPGSTGCCTPYCDLSEPNTCPGQTQSCVPVYDPNNALPGHENVGVCAVPA